jgi:hypothetical protein
LVHGGKGRAYNILRHGAGAIGTVVRRADENKYFGEIEGDGGAHPTMAGDNNELASSSRTTGGWRRPMAFIFAMSWLSA